MGHGETWRAAGDEKTEECVREKTEGPPKSPLIQNETANKKTSSPPPRLLLSPSLPCARSPAL